MDEVINYLNQRVPMILLVIGIALATIVIARRMRGLVRTGVGRLGLPDEIASLVGSIVYIATLLVGLSIALAQGGWSTAASSFLAGLGITGIIIGMAIQDIFRSYTSGIMLLYHRPYQIGDDVTIANIRGTVTAIRMHVTILRNSEGSTISIPSNAISANPITNHTRSGMRRMTLQLTLPRGTKMDSILKEIPDMLQHTIAAIAPAPAPTAAVSGLSGEGVMIEIAFWTNSDTASLSDVRTHAILAVDRLLRDHPSVNVK
jgi:small-conductance mechanosensitive channel